MLCSQRTLLDMADTFAANHHHGDIRKDGTPYIEHPRAVAIIAFAWACRRFQMDPDVSGYVYAAGLLHDVVEHGASLQLIGSTFGSNVRQFVDEVTADDSIEDFELRVETYCLKLQRASRLGALIKLADIYHNASSVGGGTGFLERWLPKARRMLAAIRDQVGHLPEYTRTLEAIDRRQQSLQRCMVRRISSEQAQPDRDASGAGPQGRVHCGGAAAGPTPVGDCRTPEPNTPGPT